MVPLAVAKVSFVFLHGSFPLDPHDLLLLHRDNTSLLQNFWCLPASQLPREQLSSLIRTLASQRVTLKAWQVSASRAEEEHRWCRLTTRIQRHIGGGPVLQGLGDWHTASLKQRAISRSSCQPQNHLECYSLVAPLSQVVCHF